MYQKKSDSKNFFKTLGVGDLQVPSVLDFAGESPLERAVLRQLTVQSEFESAHMALMRFSGQKTIA